MALKYDDKVFSNEELTRHLRRSASGDDQNVVLGKDKKLRVTETSEKLHVRLLFGTSKATITVVDPKASITYNDIAGFVDAAVDAQAFTYGGVNVTGFDSAYIETTTKTYLEAE